MQQLEIAQAGLGSSMLLDSGLLALATGFFFLVVLGYFLSSGFFQSTRRRGRFTGDGLALLLSGGLFVAFTAGYMEIFVVAFRLPFTAYQDLAIGLFSVALAGIAAFASAKAIRRRTTLRDVTVDTRTSDHPEKSTR